MAGKFAVKALMVGMLLVGLAVGRASIAAAVPQCQPFLETACIDDNTCCPIPGTCEKHCVRDGAECACELV